MRHGRPKVYRDPVHGDIEYERGRFQKLIHDLIDTESFQRLRGIRQNGVTNLVFHGAEHSRFTHSMGVACLAGRMFDAAIRNSDEQETVEQETKEARETTIIAALLHDIGHGPFSHLLEEILGKKSFNHEHFTTRFFSDPASDIRALLTQYNPEYPNRLIAFIDKSKRTEFHWYYEIVSSQLDADRLDYLARDGYMAGIQSHHFDSRRLISFLAIKDNRLAVDIRARDVLENYLLALDQMYQSVYYHHTVRSASFLVSCIIRRARNLAKDGVSDMQCLFPDVARQKDPLLCLFDQGPDLNLKDYLRLDEAHIWELLRLWRNNADRTLSDLCHRFLTRKFPKTLDFELDFQATNELLTRTRAVCTQHLTELDAEYYVEVDEPDRVGYKRYKTGEGPLQSIMVMDRNDTIKPLEEINRSIVEVISKKFIAKRLIVPFEIADKARTILTEVSR